MASTSNPKKATSLDKSGKPSPKRSPNAQKQPINPSKSKGAMGLGLLLMAIGASLVGLGGLGYLVYQELLGASEREIEQSALAQTQTIAARLNNISRSVDMTAGAARSLWQQSKPKVATPYQNLLLELFKPDSLVAGAGIVSDGNLLPPPAKGLSIYVWQQKSEIKVEPAGKPLATGLMVSSRADSINRDWYKQSVAGKSSWSQPYEALGRKIITYSAPVGDGKTTVAVVNADAIATEILALDSLDSRIGYVVFGANGAVITGSAQFAAQQSQNPAIAESIASLAQQAVAQPAGIAQSGGNLWAYRRVNGSGLVVATYLPQSEIINKLAMLVGGAAIGLSAVLVIAILGFINKLKKRLQPLVEDCDRFLAQNGDVTKHNSGDELDHLSAALKSTLQQVKSSEVRLRNELISSNDEDISRSQQVQQSLAETEMIEAEVGDLLDVVSSMEEGDLTIEAQVNDRATGLVADTLNRLREKLVEIISSVLGTAQQVANGASDLEELARTVVLNTAEQAQSVIQGQALTEQVANIAKQSAEQVNVANLSLQEVRDTVADGQTAINTLTESISVLQTGSAQIVQRMKTLGEFVGLAEQFVQDQGQIASLTQVLALNATLVAARAAEQKDPKQFASVAREFESIAGQVNDLATQTNDGLTVLQQRTSQIQTVVTAIDSEVQNLSGLVSGFTEGVESSQDAFNSIQMATEEVVQIGQSITSSSTAIAEAAGTTATYISEIAQLAERTADLTRSARQQAESMGNQAQQLLQGIQFFRLPEAAIAAINNVANAPKNFTPANVSANVSMDESASPATNQHYSNSLSDNRANAIEEEDEHSLDLVLPALAVTGAVAGAAAIAVNQFTNQQDDDSATSELVPDQYAQPQNLTSATEAFSASTENIFDLDMQSTQDDYKPDQSLSAISTEPMLMEPVDNLTDELVDDAVGLGDDFGGFYEGTQPENPDISDIEASLFADLKQEVYDHGSIDDAQLDGQMDDLSDHDELPDDLENSGEFDQIGLSQDQNMDLAQDLDPTSLDIANLNSPFTNPLEDVNQQAIAEASTDPMIALATSSFLEDTQFGAPAPLSEEMLANVPASVDFAIPTLENDDDFAIPPMQIESSLDDSNSFFDATAYNNLIDNATNLDDPFAVSYGEAAGDDPFGITFGDADSDMSDENTDGLLSPVLGAESNFDYNFDETPTTFDLNSEIDEAMGEPLNDGYEYPYAIDYNLEDNFDNGVSESFANDADAPSADATSDVDSFNSFTDRLVDYAADANVDIDIDTIDTNVNPKYDASEFNLNFSEVLDDDDEFEESSNEFDTRFLIGLSEDVFTEGTSDEFGNDFAANLVLDDADLDVDLDADLKLESTVDESPVNIFEQEFEQEFEQGYNPNSEAIANNIEEEGSFEISFIDSNDLDVSLVNDLDLAFNLEEDSDVETESTSNIFDGTSEHELPSLSMVVEQFQDKSTQQDFGGIEEESMSGYGEMPQALDASLAEGLEDELEDFNRSESLDESLDDASLSDNFGDMITAEPIVELDISEDALGLDDFTDEMGGTGYNNFGEAIALDENNDFSNNDVSNNVISDLMTAIAPDLSSEELRSDGFGVISELDKMDDVSGLDNILNDLSVDTEVNLLDGSEEMEDFMGEDDLGIISEVNPIGESAGLNFSDSWLDDIIDDKLDDDDDTSAVFGSFSTGFPSLDDLPKSIDSQPDPSVADKANSFIDDLMGGNSMDNLLDSEDNAEFDFSAFEDLSKLLQANPQPSTQTSSAKPPTLSEAKPNAHNHERQVSEAQSEIEAFLSSDSLENNESL